MIAYPHEVPPAAGEAIPVADGIFWIRMPLPFALNHINLWLLADHDEQGACWTIVDTGYGVVATHDLWRQHFAATMQGGRVKRIIVTHYHPDHVGCASWLHEQTGAPVWMTAAEYLSAHAAAEDVAGFDRDNSARLFLSHGLARLRPDFAAAQQARSGAYKRGVPTVPKQYFRIMDGDVIRIGKRIIRMNAPEELPRVLLYHKPEGEIVSYKDPQGRPSVFDKLPHLRSSKWIAIGRLDFNTSGLLIFTDKNAS